jgi:hypothetical protein
MVDHESEWSTDYESETGEADSTPLQSPVTLNTYLKVKSTYGNMEYSLTPAQKITAQTGILIIYRDR